MRTSRRRSVAGLVVCLASAGCPEDDGSSASGPDAGTEGSTSDLGQGCPRFEELRGDTCHPVEVRDFEELDASFERAGLTLHGTLALPRTDGTYLAPGIVLVHGSGPLSRDAVVTGSLGVQYGEEIPIFRSLALQLVARGFAVLRYDKRNCFAEQDRRCPTRVADYPGDIDDMLPTDFAEDAVEAVRALSDRPEVRGSDIAVLGHSQGGSFTPWIAAQLDEVTAAAILAGPALSLIDSLAGQIEDYADALEAEDSRGNAARIADLRDEAASYRRDWAEIEDGTYEGSTFLGAPLSFVEDWSRWHDDTERNFRELEKPVLALCGDRDLNVGPGHLERYEAWAEGARSPRVRTTLLPDVTHALVVIDDDDALVDRNVSREVVDEIADFLGAP